jgi:type I restriction enzyme, S subunit
VNQVLIGDFLHRIKRPVKLEADQTYKLVTVKLNHKGVVLRHEKLGSEIMSTMYEVKTGDFILSGIDARNGAFGIVPPELDGAVVTNDFWYFNIDQSKVDKQFFLELTSTQWFDEICRKGSDGTTQRIRLQKSKFFNQKIDLPDLKEQHIFIKRFLRLKSQNSELSSELSYQQTLLKMLRQQILQDAIEGKLTAEWRAANPDVEPASELLKRITTEKGQLVKDKKIKPQNPIPPISEEEKPFKLPDRWLWTRLGYLVESYHNGLSKRSGSKGVPVIVLRLADINNYQICFDSQREIVLDENEQAKYSLLENDILITRVNGSVDIVGNFNNCKHVLNQIAYCDHFIRMRMMLQGELASFVFIVEKTAVIRDRVKAEFKTTSGQKTINQGHISNYLLPLPPLTEQKVIVAKVEKLFAVCDQLEAQINQNQTHAKQLMQAVLKEAFSHDSKPQATINIIEEVGA